MKLEESLAKAIIEAWLRRTEDHTIGACGNRSARAALAHLKVPKDAESVDVGEAVAALRRGCEFACGSTVTAECGRCEQRDALRALGIKD